MHTSEHATIQEFAEAVQALLNHPEKNLETSTLIQDSDFPKITHLVHVPELALLVVGLAFQIFIAEDTPENEKLFMTVHELYLRYTHRERNALLDQELIEVARKAVRKVSDEE